MYADKDFYKNVYLGTLIPDAELDSFLAKASESVDELTMFRIPQRGGIDKLTTFQQKQVRIATCDQADFLFGVKDMPEWVQNYSVGDISLSRRENSSLEFSHSAIRYLKSTNLMYRGQGS